MDASQVESGLVSHETKFNFRSQSAKTIWLIEVSFAFLKVVSQNVAFSSRKNCGMKPWTVDFILNSLLNL